MGDGVISALKNRIKGMRYTYPAAAFAAGITLAVYLSALQNGFVNWDDDGYVYNNKNIQSIDSSLLKWIFTFKANPTWHPLTLFSHSLDYATWGLAPWGHHLTNILLHSLNTFLVFILTYKIIDLHGINCGSDLPQKKVRATVLNLTAGIITSLLFGLHPLHVESVAWISERKDVLYAFFFLLSLIAYIRYISARGATRGIFYSTSLILFALSLMSKPMAVSLPLVLLLLDFYPLKRLMRSNIWMIAKEKLPFFMLSIFSSVLTILGHSEKGVLQSLETVPLIARISVAARSMIFYLIKMVMPVGLSPLYPHPGTVTPFAPEYFGSIILLSAITLICVLRKNKLFLAIWLYYIITLIPASGIVQVGAHAAADRYMYLPSLGPFLFLGLGIGTFIERNNKKTLQIAVLSALIVLSGMMINRTLKQISVWHDSITLWTHVIKLFPYRSDTPYFNRGLAYEKIGNRQEASRDFKIAMMLQGNEGKAYRMDFQGRQRSIKDYDEIVKLNPSSPLAYYDRGKAHLAKGDNRSAIKDFDMAIKLDPKHADAYYNRGNAYCDIRDYQQAVSDFSKAIELDPMHMQAYGNRGSIYYITGKFRKAIDDYDKAIKLAPQNADIFFNRGNAYYKLEKYEEAIDNFKQVADLNPQDAEAYFKLGSAYSKMGNSREANIFYKKAKDLGFKEGNP